MRNEICIVCVAFGERYIEQQERLKQSIANVCPEVHTMFWSDTLPKDSKPFKESLYGFKPHAVKAALDAGYKKIVFLDPACIVLKPLDYYFTLGLPVVAARDDNKLKNHIGDRAMMYYSLVSISETKNLVGGSLYVFDFNHVDCSKIFNSWMHAEQSGIFGSQKDQASGKLNKHRNDESCMAMSLYNCGYEPVGCDVARYCSGPDTIIDKKHFK